MTAKKSEAEPRPPHFPDITVEISNTPATLFRDMLAIRKALHDAGHASRVPDFVYRTMDAKTQAEFTARCQEWVTIKII